MSERYGAGGVAITLDKRVPFGAGLGGGSSDAATVIVAVNQIYNLGLSEGEMCAVAAELGSDTSFFVCGTPQLCTSRGEVMTPFELDVLQGKWIAIVKPPFGVSTPQAYAGVKPAIPTVPLAERLKADPSEWHKNITNDFESTVFAQFPSLAVIKQSLYDSGALYASMSGSGSAMFGLFDSEPKLEFAEDYFVFVGRV
jgi:4-diphosphocytidyl-2-C-methyl-D-erythritol kinase